MTTPATDSMQAGRAPRAGTSRRMLGALLPALALLLGVGASQASAQGTTRTVVYAVGTVGAPDRAEFTWTVTKVTAQGTFIDGTPWITVEPGAEVVALSPMSEQRTTARGMRVYVNGSARNPRMQSYYSPTTLAEVALAGGNPFDSRQCFPSPPSQQQLDLAYPLASNVGLPVSGGAIAPVPVAAGDVVVTARSQWLADGSGDWDGTNLLPHVTPGRRSPIDRFGVLTVLAAPLAEPSFRPPMQWPRGAESSRPAPIPLSRVRVDDAALLHGATGSYGPLEKYLSSPTFFDSSFVLYQSSHAHYAFSSDPADEGLALTYSGNTQMRVMRPALFAATDTSLPVATRTLMRDRLVQYGIDAYGATMSLGVTYGVAGQRSAEMKAWIMLAGWWVGEPAMMDPYAAVRSYYANTAVATLGDVALGNLLFHDDAVCRQVVAGIGLGAPYNHRWGPGEAYQVTSAAIEQTTGFGGLSSFGGVFGRLEVNGVVLHPEVHGRKPLNYPGMSLRIESGAGAGPTIYRVTEVGGTDAAFGDWIRIDRPWQHGMPGPTSVVRMFPFRTPDVEPGMTADLGRWYFSRSGGALNSTSLDNISPINSGYARVSFRSFIAPHAALRALYRATGNQRFLAGSTWRWLDEVVGGTGRAVDGTVSGLAPDAERLTNLVWDDYDYAGLSASRLAAVKAWIGRNDASSPYGVIDPTRLPGYGLVPNLCHLAVAGSTGDTAVTVASGTGNVQVPASAAGPAFLICNARVYRIAPSAGGIWSAAFAASAPIAPAIAVFATCAGDVVLAAASAPSSGTAVATLELAQGVEYFVVVGGRATSQVGAGTLSVKPNYLEGVPRRLLVSLSGITSLPGVPSFADEDVLLFDGRTGAWSLYFDGSDVGLGSSAIDALSMLADGSLLISTTTDVKLTGLVGGPDGTKTTRCDVLRFVPSSLGATTTGQWHFYFDGSDVDLTANGSENVNALHALPDGSLLMATNGAPTVPGLSGITQQDVLRFVPTSLGSVTAGRWEQLFDGSDVGLTTSAEAIGALSMSPLARISIATTGNFAAGGLTGTDDTVVDFWPFDLGPITNGIYRIAYAGAGMGLPAAAKINALQELPLD